MSGPAAKLAPVRGPAVQRRPSSLRIASPDDAHEARADHAARQALAGSGDLPGPPAAPARRRDTAPAGLENRIASARGEGRALAPEQRAFFAPRFGHHFDSVSIHAGPAAAAAANAARAQAFTLGRDIYFGDGRYRPDSGAGRSLLAHELAHTLQDRPGVVARRALDTPFDAPESDPTANAGPGRMDSDPAVDEMATLVQAGPVQGNEAAREALEGMDPAQRPDALATLRTRLPATEHSKVAALSKSGHEGKAGGIPPNARPQLHAADTVAAPVTAAPADPQTPAPAHARVAGAAAARMQQAVRAVGTNAAVESAPAMPGSLDTGTASSAPTGGAASSGASTAAQGVTATLGARIAALQGVQGLPVQFREDPQAPQGDPQAFTRMLRSQSLATQFAGGAAAQIQAVLSAAAAVPAQAMAALGGARQAISAQAAAQGAALAQGAAAARTQIRNQAARVRGAIAARHAKADSDMARETQAASGRAAHAHDTAANGLDRRANSERQRIALSYDDALHPMIGVGIEVGGLARDAAETRAQGLLSRRNGESTVLDGPIHDDRLEADADASRQVGEEYAKSFRQTASEQADKLPESRPEILGKVDEITGQARTGFADQLAQILQGATALETGAKARANQAAAQMRGALDANAAQSQQALDAAEAQQAAALQGQADAAQSALDQSVGAALTSFGEGVGQAAEQLAASLHSFIQSAAAMPPPDPEELAAGLAESDPSAALTTMGAQVATVVPTLAGILTDGQQSSGAAMTAAAADATQGFTGSAAAFAQGAGSLNQQSAAGFKQLGTGNTRDTTNLASDAEAGFAEAVTNANTAYSQFGDQVEDTFRAGRLQMHDGLWSLENQGKLDKQMETSGKDAADHVKPRWKRVLKWVVMIAVIVAVIAITVLSAGSLGPVGVILLGAALGAAAGAVQTIADNLIDGEPWSKGVVKAMIVGAVGGAVGGAGGVLLKGVGSVGLRIALEGGVNIIGGVAGEALGSVATGQSVNWTGALMGALVGAGIGAGLGIAGAIRGRIRVGSIGEPAVPPPPRPVIEVPPAPPVGRIRSALEATKILAPRPAPAIPEVNVSTGAGPGPDAVAAPRLPDPIGFRAPGEPPRVATPASDAAAPRVPDPIGFRPSGEAPRVATPVSEAAPPRVPDPIGFRPPGEQPRVATQVSKAAPPRVPDPIGFRPPGQPRAAAPSTEVAAPRQPELATGERRLIGFGDRGTTIERPPSGTRNLIGFGERGTVTEPIAPAQTGSGPVQGSVRASPHAMVIEASVPRPHALGSTVEPIRAGGRSGSEIRAVAEPPKPAGANAGSGIVEPPRPMLTEPANTQPPPEPAIAPKPTQSGAPGPESANSATEAAPAQDSAAPRDGDAEFNDFQDWLHQEGSDGLGLDIGKRRAQQISAGERDFSLDTRGRVDVDEPLAVGEPGIKPQRAVARALDPQNRQFLDAMTNQRTKYTRISPEDVLRNRAPQSPVTIDPAAPTGPGHPPIADPSVLFERRFGEIAEMREIFDDAVGRIGNRNALSPTQLKARINANIRDIIKNARSPAGQVVRSALDSLGYEFGEFGLVARK